MLSKMKDWTGQSPVFSEDPATRAIELAFLNRLSSFLNLDGYPGKVLDMATDGTLLAIFPEHPDDNTPPEPVAFDSIKPFDYDKWVKEGRQP